MNWDRIRVTFVVSALAMLGGCVAVPVDSGYYAGSPGYYAAPAYYGPSIGVEVSGDGRGYGRSYHRGYGYR